MIRNYIKTAFRNLLKNKGFTAINITGLALGLTTCLLIVFYVADELSYDRFNTQHERIYRVNTDLKYGNVITNFAITAPGVGDAMVQEFPEVEKSARIGGGINIRFKKGDEIIDEPRAFYTENSIFGIFTLPLLRGDVKTALVEPHSIVISKSTALKYFNSVDVLDKTLFMVSDSIAHKITGVMEDMPAQSHFRADVLLGMDPNQDHNWTHFNTNIYILLKPGANLNKIENKLDALIRAHMTTPTFNYSTFSKKGNYIRLSLTPLKDIHLKSNRQRELAPNGNEEYIYIFSVVAVLILLLACINFMNLSTARSANRAREVGVRKVLGSARKYLVFQFLSESVIVTLAASVIAVFAAWALLPFFNQISGKEIAMNMQLFSWLLPSLLVIIVVVGLLAGSYPAFFLSAFKPIEVLKGKLATGFKGRALRSSLVVFQFAISIFLIAGTIIVYNQLNFIKNKDLGFKREQVVTIKNIYAVRDASVFKQEIKRLSGVENATLSMFSPTGTVRFPLALGSSGNTSTQAEFWTVDEDYLNTMSIPLKEGRNFSKEFSTDSLAVIVNETASKAFGYKTGSTEKIISGDKEYRIIGVVKDFNFSSLRDNVTPLVMVLGHQWAASLTVKLKTNDQPHLMGQIENKWKEQVPGQHFEYAFMDDQFNAIYSNEQRMGTLFAVFATLAIIIACLGLFGMAAYAAEQRNREISIRKVLGASVSNITAMLSKDFVRLVIIAIVIAVPLAWLIMQKWLQGYAYRQTLHWWVFAIAGLGAIVVALITVSYQSIRAAMANPVDSLRGE